MGTKKVIVTLLLITSFFFLGYFRSYVFLTVNAQSSAVYYHVPGPALPGLLSFLADKSYIQIIRIKWLFTLLFTLLFCAAAVVGLYIIYKKRLYIKLCLFFYAGLSLFALVCMLGGYLKPAFSVHAYNIARNLMHVAQSPFTIAIMIVLAYYHKKIS